MINYITDFNKNQELLRELSIRKNQQRVYAPIIAHAISNVSHIAEQTAMRLFTCGSYISVNNAGKITGANFCRHRYCPICQWRSSRKVYGEICMIYNKIKEDNPNCRFALLTLTIRNTTSLEDGVQQCFEGIKRFTNDRRIKKSIRGYMRTLEITRSEKNETWHPHIHMLIHVDNDYFCDEKKYLTQKDYEKIWRRCVQASYITQVDIRAIKGENNLQKAIAEVAKYAVKPSSVLTSTATVDTITELISSTYHRRLRSYGGSFKKAAKALNIKSAEPVDELPDAQPTDSIYVYVGNSYMPIQNAPQKAVEDVALAEISYEKAKQTVNCCMLEKGGGANAG